MKTLFLLFILIFGPSSFAKTKNPEGCDFNFKKENLCATLTWVKNPVKSEMPTEKDAAAFDLQFWKTLKNQKQNFPLPEGENFALSLFMPGMGHGSEGVQISKDSATPGLYHVTHVLFSMSGDWEIRMKLKRDKKEIDAATLPYKF